MRSGILDAMAAAGVMPDDVHLSDRCSGTNVGTEADPQLLEPSG